jgi:NhaP-type Na+/H+ or K+/H+ antiporter
MHEHILQGLALIFVAGAVAQCIGWRLRIPPIIFLLGAGLVIGPATGFLKPDEIFGDLLFPLVSMAVSVILFEGGLTLKFKELHSSGRVILHLTTLGVILSWSLASFFAHILLHFPLGLSILTGAILVVTGPTVIGPMLRIIRPRGKVGDIAKWEGILNDPIGAILAVLVYEMLMLGSLENAPMLILLGIG